METETKSAPGSSGFNSFAVLIAVVQGILGLFCWMVGLRFLQWTFWVGAAIALIFGSAVSSTEIKGECPHCKSTVVARTTDQGVDCPGCKRRLLIRDGRLIGIE